MINQVRNLPKRRQSLKKQQQDDIKFFGEQLKWCKKQDRILGETGTKLFQMKRIAEIVLEFELTFIEIAELNSVPDKLPRDHRS